jgi:ribulose-phosphate 3-epimerase
MVLIMTVNPGFGGQSFIMDMLPKIRKTKELIIQENMNIDIQVDGGINQETITLALKEGADIFVAGSTIFKSSNRTEIMRSLRSRIS